MLMKTVTPMAAPVTPDLSPLACAGHGTAVPAFVPASVWTVDTGVSGVSRIRTANQGSPPRENFAD